MRTTAIEVVLLLIVTAITNCPAAYGALDNDGVRAMKRAGLGDVIIIKKIESSQVVFDLSTEALIELKQAGVSDDVLAAMMSRNKGDSEEANRGLSYEAQVYLDRDGQLVAVEYTAAFVKTLTSPLSISFTYKTKVALIVSGDKAPLRLAVTSPAFLSRIHPSEITWVRFSSDRYDRKPVRYVSMTRDAFSFGQNHAGIPNRSTIDFESERAANGLYKIRPKAPLAPGEYGIMVVQSTQPTAPMLANGRYRVYDFGIEPVSANEEPGNESGQKASINRATVPDGEASP